MKWEFRDGITFKITSVLADSSRCEEMLDTAHELSSFWGPVGCLGLVESGNATRWQLETEGSARDQKFPFFRVDSRLTFQTPGFASAKYTVTSVLRKGPIFCT